MSPLSITESNISIAWAKAFLRLMESAHGQAHPALISIRGLDRENVIEDENIRARLDRELARVGVNQCSSVGGTIFPNSMWNPALTNSADMLFKRYERAWPGISKCPANRNGVYFRRLTAFQPKDRKARPVNQLTFVIDTYKKGNHRKSALQVSILDPTRDHTHSRQKGFPCLQQVAFTPLGQGLMSVTGYYATQYQFEKAYGNYLGLYGLGRFMAGQLGLSLAQVTCFATVLNLGNLGKSKLAGFARDLDRMVN